MKGASGQGRSMTNIQMQLFAKNVDDLPHVFRVGDIIRVHRVNINDY